VPVLLPFEEVATDGLASQLQVGSRVELGVVHRRIVGIQVRTQAFGKRGLLHFGHIAAQQLLVAALAETDAQIIGKRLQRRVLLERVQGCAGHIDDHRPSSILAGAATQQPGVAQRHAIQTQLFDAQRPGGVARRRVAVEPGQHAVERRWAKLGFHRRKIGLDAQQLFIDLDGAITNARTR
jgi:hypothetical protein